MPTDLSLFIFVAVGAAFLAGLYGERWRARLARRAWQRKRGGQAAPRVVPVARPEKSPVTDAADQLRLVMDAPFEKRPLMSKSEARFFYFAEEAVRAQRLNWRVMAQVSLGEVIRSPDARAHSAINSKRVDILLVTNTGQPMAAIEFQGDGHYQGTAPARDAVKKEALRRAGVGYIEVTPKHDRDDVAREIARIAGKLGRDLKSGNIN